jgi:hypothetical protein
VTENPADWSIKEPVGRFTVTADEANAESARDFAISVRALIDKAKALVDMLDDAERNHGGLYAGKTMTASNELRLELAKWGVK